MGATPPRAVALVDRSLHSTGGFGTRRDGRRNHQSEPLEQEDGALCSSPPDKLAPLSLAILHVDVSARILQATVLEGAVYEYPLIKDHMLVLEDIILVSIHGITNDP